jgi:hypothetical protein
MMMVLTTDDDAVAEPDGAPGIRCRMVARSTDAEARWWSASMFDIFGLDPAGGVPTAEIFHLYHPTTQYRRTQLAKMFASDTPYHTLPDHSGQRASVGMCQLVNVSHRTTTADAGSLV